MSPPLSSRPIALKIFLWSLLAFALLAIRFSPNWMVFCEGAREARLGAVTPEQRATIDGAILNGYSARGHYVIQQTLNLSAEIPDPNHKIIRWRLLMPALGHFLHLPGWLVLSLAHFGSLFFIVTLVALCVHQTAVRPGYEGMCFGIVAGATAPFFTSMGLLGYYDAWLALALLGVSFARPRWIVFIACILAPWIDERFVIGLPLALCVRWIRYNGGNRSPWQWFKQEAIVPFVIVAGYTMFRLGLGGSGSSQTVGE